MRAVKDKELAATIIAGANAQEEVGLRGAKGAVHRYQPDAFIAVDCSPADDTDGNKDKFGQLGGGFLLRVQDPGHITHRGMREFLLDTAETHKIPYQYFFSKGGTDAGAAHVSNDGVPSAVIAPFSANTALLNKGGLPVKTAKSGKEFQKHKMKYPYP